MTEGSSGAPAAGAGKQGGIVLIVDDEPAIRLLHRAVLEREGYEVVEAASATEARAALEGEDGVDAVLLDVMMPRQSGLELLRELRDARPGLPVVMVTASIDVGHAVEALRARAFDYLVKPVRADELRLVARNAVERGQMSRELAARRLLDPSSLPTSGGAVFASRPMQAVLGIIDQVRDSATPVMVLGESGTGKEVIARTLHERSSRKRGPFVAVNCAALPASLVESELFGHEKGAFTGAAARRKGRFEEASGGTLFLDEVGELDLAVQAKLLRTLQEREVTRVGGGTIKVDARVVVATHRDLATMVREGRFREDLFYRLDVITLRLPPLRERPDDIAPLALSLLSRICRDEHLPVKELTLEALEALRGRRWRGNVRELENTLKRSALLSPRTTLGPADLVYSSSEEPEPAPPPAQAAPPSTPPQPSPTDDADEGGVKPMREYERDLMLRALAQAQGSVSEASRLLGIGRTTFYRRAKRHGVPL